jgi:hypothetical protein
LINKLNLGDRVITTRDDGEIGTVIDITGAEYGSAQISFDDGSRKWIGVDYLTVETGDNRSSGTPEAPEAVI